MNARLVARLAGGAVLGAAVLGLAVPTPAMASPKVLTVSPRTVRPGGTVLVRLRCAKGVKRGRVTLTRPTRVVVASRTRARRHIHRRANRRVASSRLRYRGNGILTAYLRVPRTMPRGRFRVVAVCGNEHTSRVANVYVTKRVKRTRPAKPARPAKPPQRRHSGPSTGTGRNVVRVVESPTGDRPQG
ncbi:MAG: hypothetical protein ACJ73S_29945 [Mycobacteriales bacterium]